MAIIKKSAPWVEYYRQVNALFDEDPDIRVIYNEEINQLNLYVNNTEKAEALSRLLPTGITFGNVTMEILVTPSNLSNSYKGDLIAAALKGNAAVSRIVTIDDVFANKITYVIFRRGVVQYFDDDLSDYHGVHSTLYENIAREVFEDLEGVFFCTDVVDF